MPHRNLAAVLVLLAGALPAQNAVTVDPEVSPKMLRARLKPLTRAELEVEAAAWRDLLQQRAQAISQVQVASMTEEGGDQETIATLPRLQEEQTVVADRMRIVLDALEARGGDVAQYRTYLTAVTGITLEADVNKTWTIVNGWLRSKEGGIRWGTNLALFLATLIVFKIISLVLGAITRQAAARMKKSSALLRDFFVSMVRKVTMFIGLIVALSMLEVNIGPFLAGIGAVGLVLGFALQETLNNFAAGLMILVYRPYDLGDVVTVAGVTGKVGAMSLVSTTLVTPDNQTVVVPNGSIWGGIITNITGRSTRRVDMVFGISYDDDIGKAQQILQEIVEADERVLADPAPAVMVVELADSAVNLACRPWVRTGDYWDVLWDLNRTVKERFDAAGISIPYPQQDVHMHQVAPPGS
jgi:small conductance mechanosensitive channel